MNKLLILFALPLLAQTPPQRTVICTDAGASDTYACTPDPAISSYTTGLRVTLYANTANTGAATVNISALGAKTIVKVAGGISTTLADNDIRAGQYVSLTYDGTNFQMGSMLGNAGGGGASPLTTKGDLYTYSTADARLPVGTDGYVLSADSGATTGNAWKLRGRFATVGITTAQAFTGGTDTDLTGASFTIPANSMGANGCVRLTAYLQATGTTKTFKVSFGGTTISPINGVSVGSGVTLNSIICNVAATNVQTITGQGFNNNTFYTNQYAAGTVDTTAAVTLKLVVQGINSDTVQIRMIMVEVLP